MQSKNTLGNAYLQNQEYQHEPYCSLHKDNHGLDFLDIHDCAYPHKDGAVAYQNHHGSNLNHQDY